jgi:ABC-2 type transport system permease protein
VNTTLAIAFREYRIRLVNPILPLWDVLVPVVYLLIFGSSMERWLQTDAAAHSFHYPTFLLGGVLAMVTFSIAMNSSYAFFEDLQSGIFYEILTYPFPRRDLLIGKLLFNGAFGVVASTLCVIAGVVMLGIRIDWVRLPLLLLWVMVGTAGWYFLYCWISLKVRGFNAYHTTTSSMYLVMMFVSNLFYPAEQLPRWIAWFAYLNPITWQVDVLRHIAYGEGMSTAIQLEAAAYIGFSLLAFWMADRILNSPME